MKPSTVPDWQEEPGNDREEDDWVVLRVGGQVFETSLRTLCADKDYMLAALVLRRWPKDEKNNQNSVIRIDRDGQRFAHVLNYLRGGTACVQDVGLLRGLQEEADFFCLAGFSALCDEQIQRIEEAEEAKRKMDIKKLRKMSKNTSRIKNLGEMPRNVVCMGADFIPMHFLLVTILTILFVIVVFLMYLIIRKF